MSDSNGCSNRNPVNHGFSHLNCSKMSLSVRLKEKSKARAAEMASERELNCSQNDLNVGQLLDGDIKVCRAPVMSDILSIKGHENANMMSYRKGFIPPKPKGKPTTE